MWTLYQRENNRLLFVRRLNLLHTVTVDKTKYAKKQRWNTYIKEIVH